MERRRTERLLRERPALFVSLPRNDIRLAEAALEGGADGLKVHLNVAHHASGTYFGSWSEEASTIRAILAGGAPVGMVPGTAERTLTPAEAHELADAGIDFFDAYLQDMPAWLPEETPEVSIMAAFGTGDAARGWNLGALAGHCQLLELSIVPAEAYGSPLEEADLATYRDIVERYPGLLAIVPTQRAIRPEQVQALLATGVRGVLIGAIVTGKTPESVERVTREFAAATHAA
jgi:hypothetical protein